MTFPKDIKYTEEHEWARQEGDLVRIGVSAYAADQLGEITYVELPRKGARVEKSTPCGSIDAVKTVSDLFSPVSGVVEQVNGELEGDPSMVNSSPYQGGWMLLIRPDTMSALTKLMDATAYAAFTGEGH